LCTDDLGAVAARVFADPATWSGAVLSLASDVRTIGECREIWQHERGRAPRGLPLPAWLFERMAGKDLTTMWRWLRTGRFDLATEPTREILPSARTVPEWIAEQMRNPA
jgi:hypothetical protein